MALPVSVFLRAIERCVVVVDDDEDVELIVIIAFLVCVCVCVFFFLLFVAGQYGLLTPFFNAKFNGRVARFIWSGELGANVQELDLETDNLNPGLYHGYRGGWASLWQGVDF